MPRPDAKVKPAFVLDDGQRTRAAELQMRLLGSPGDGTAALELADIFMDARHPDWALAVLGPPVEANPADHRLHWRRSLAYAEHFEAAPAYRSVERALAL